MTPRWQALAGLAIAMMLHDRMKLAGALVGVVFATVLSAQQAGVFLGLLEKSTMLVEHCTADVWIVPPGVRQPQPGPPLTEDKLYRARTVPGVASADPLYWVGGSVDIPGGTSEQVTILGIDVDHPHGLPFFVVAGDPKDLAQPRAMFFDASERERLGGLDLGSLREVNDHQVQVVGFTSGLLPFGPSFAFADERLARELADQVSREPTMVLVEVLDGHNPEVVAQRLRDTLTDVTVYTARGFANETITYLLTETAIGVTFGTSALFGLVVGFVIVALTMFSSVVDNLKEFGTLKAIGADNADLARLLWVQATLYGLGGSGLGILLVGVLAVVTRSPRLSMSLPLPLVLGLIPLMLFICAFASVLALLRVRRLEPAMVFRG